MSLRKKLIRLAYQNEDLRPHILPLLKQGSLSQRIKDWWLAKSDVRAIRTQIKEWERTVKSIEQEYVSQMGGVKRALALVQKKNAEHIGGNLDVSKAVAGVDAATKGFSEQVDELLKGLKVVSKSLPNYVSKSKSASGLPKKTAQKDDLVRIVHHLLQGESSAYGYLNRMAIAIDDPIRGRVKGVTQATFDRLYNFWFIEMAASAKTPAKQFWKIQDLLQQEGRLGELFGNFKYFVKNEWIGEAASDIDKELDALSDKLEALSDEADKATRSL